MGRVLAPVRPNVLLIVADDLNAWIGALGRNPDVRTPHIDALAERGTLFTHAYCAAPFCHSSRISLFTGRQPVTSGIYHREDYPWEDPGRPPTFIELLHDGGYRTFGAGKVFHGGFSYKGAYRQGQRQALWQQDRGNDATVWDEFSQNVYDPLPRRRPSNGPADLDSPDAPRVDFAFDWAPVGPGLEAQLPDRRATDAVVSFLSEAPPEPFFCAAGLYKPHLPWYVPSRFFDLYTRHELSLPVVKRDDLDDVPRRGRQMAAGSVPHAVIEQGYWRGAVHAYLAAISYCDALIGELMAALDASGTADRTLVVLAGDNGFHLGEKLHWCKLTLWEEATRIPLIVVPPGARARAARVHHPVSLVDVFPTMLELCGIDPIPPNDGLSLADVLEGDELGQRPERRPALMTWLPGNHSVRSPDWRYIRYADRTEELYDHRADPYEWHNLAGRARYRPVVADLSRWVPDDDDVAEAFRKGERTTRRRGLTSWRRPTPATPTRPDPAPRTWPGSAVRRPHGAPPPPPGAAPN